MKTADLKKYKQQILSKLQLSDDRTVFFFSTHFDALQQVHMYGIASICLQTGKTHLVGYGKKVRTSFDSLTPFDMTSITLHAEENGLLAISKLEEALSVRTACLSIELIDENSNLQDIVKIGKLCHERNLCFHVDISRATGLLNKIDGLEDVDFITCDVDPGSFLITPSESSFIPFRPEEPSPSPKYLEKVEKATSRFMELAATKEQLLNCKKEDWTLLDFPNLPTHLAIYCPQLHGEMVCHELKSRKYQAKTLIKENIIMDPKKMHGMVMVELDGLDRANFQKDLAAIYQKLHPFTKQLFLNQGEEQ